MERREIEAIVRAVMEQCENVGSAGTARKPAEPLTFPVEASASHVHLTAEAVEILFGRGTALTPDRYLSQPGEYLSGQRLKLSTYKGELSHVAVLGPVRKNVQVELSLSDIRRLGITAPVNLSGDLSGAGDILLIGPAGALEAKRSVIAARAHIHMTPEDAKRFGVKNGQEVKVRVEGERTIIFEKVVVRVGEHYGLAMHMDFDEANACCLGKNTRGVIVP